MPGDAKASVNRPKPVVLCVLDGWGERAETANNAIALADAPNWRRFMAEMPHALIQASAADVGLPSGQMGNSEVGHMNLGAGRVVMQDMPRIDAGIDDGSLKAKAELAEFVTRLKESGGTCHLMGLISPGGVHSHQNQIAALAQAVGEKGVPVAVHAFLDGRDTPPKSALGYLEDFEAKIADVPGPGIVTVTGRYYAMDRDKRWERVVRAYDVIVSAKGESADSAADAVNNAYARDETDEFVAPTRIGDYAGMKDGDGIFMGNFRADRAREILSALVDPAFDGFERSRVVDLAARLGLTEYSTKLNAFLDTLYPLESLDNILSAVLANAGMHQLRIAETEKYAHVTFFFNGGVEEPFPGEDRILVPSPKVATYDLKPEMSAPEVTDKLVEAIGSGKFDFILVNYANGDMVGHTGNLEAAIKAVEAVDACLGQLAEAVETAGGTLLITADHGNAEQMLDEAGDQPHTAHTTNLVPLILINPPAGMEGVANGRLADLAPTILDLMGIAQPREMTGHSLLAGAGGEGETQRAAASA
ncbi:MAG TPA: 2,3-bisphosphoglycerate-independent phosphoglycerate mutase [Alphaproteobacteria bacterium]|nr:2,3-bisphosphoglycerate-independent phosphoglycerate mutase [Alphaproteobacteria bacterium]